VIDRRTRVGFSSKYRRGSILIYVLWISALLGFFTLSIGYGVRQKIKVVERIEARRNLRLAVESGVERALWSIHQTSNDEKKADSQISLWSHSDRLFKALSAGQVQYSVFKSPNRNSRNQDREYGLVDEESKININKLTDSKVLKVLLMLTAGTDEADSSAIADSILDWIDEDDHVNASGAETRYYQGLKRPLIPKNDRLDALEELLYVKGMSSAILANLRPYLTLYGDGLINLNTASSPVLAAVGMDEESLSLIMTYRNGVDQKPGSEDDGVLYSPFDLLSFADNSGLLSSSARASLEQLINRGFFKVTSDYFEVYVEASRQSGLELLTARAVLSRENGIQSWSEVNTRRA